MRALFLASLVTLSLPAFSSTVERAKWTIDCEGLYQKSYVRKYVRKKSAYDKGRTVTLAMSPAAAISPVVALVLAPSSAAMIYGLIPSKEERVLELIDEYSLNIDKILKKARKTVPEATEAEAIEIIKEGFHSGKFCENAPNLYSFRKVKKHVVEIFEKRYLD